MTRALKTLVDPETISYYHCMGRCVRRAWLWGEDRVPGRNYEHRKNWVVTRLAELAEVFTLDVCAYAVMSNHYHLVVRLAVEKARALSEDEVIARYSRLFKVPLLVERYLDGLASEAENLVAQKILTQWRERLCNLSWYMRGLNEYLARRANAEDGCKGRFWTAPAHPCARGISESIHVTAPAHPSALAPCFALPPASMQSCARGIRPSLDIEGRYKSQALLDDAAVLTCMSYVDLNPICANMAETPEDSDFTSIQQRIRHLQPQSVSAPQESEEPVPAEAVSVQPPLMPLVKASQDDHVHVLGYTERDYLELVDWAGRAVRADKRGAIPSHIPPTNPKPARPRSMSLSPPYGRQIQGELTAP